MTSEELSNMEIANNLTMIDRYHKKRTGVKAFAGLAVFVCFLNDISVMKVKHEIDAFSLVLWILTILAVVILFIVEVKYVQKIKEREIKNYELEKDALERKKKSAEIRKEFLPDYIMNKTVVEPVREITLPIIFYFFAAVINMIMGIWMFVKI